VGSLFDDITFLFDAGGLLVWPLVMGAALLWFSLGYRLLCLRRGTSLGVRKLLRHGQSAAGSPERGLVTRALFMARSIRQRYSGDVGRRIDQALSPLLRGAGRFRTLARSIVIAAPLIGLLGTVSGMVEMFESLSSQVFFSQEGGVANGISRALVTTQLGLAVAVPGMVVGRLLDRRERRIREELVQIRDRLSQPAGTGDAA
jgi:biopolymer transport protein ExbB